MSDFSCFAIAFKVIRNSHSAIEIRLMDQNDLKNSSIWTANSGELNRVI